MPNSPPSAKRRHSLLDENQYPVFVMNSSPNSVSNTTQNVIGVDVGSNSVRVAILQYNKDERGKVWSKFIVRKSMHIRMYNIGVKYEQSSSEIWKKICMCVKDCLKDYKARDLRIDAIGFSATCSLVLEGYKPTNNVEYTNRSHLEGKGQECDVIMWLDHRAVKEASKITRKDMEILKSLGEICSPEFSLAKLFWLKKNQPSKFESCTGFYELPDWLVRKCTAQSPDSERVTSLCSITCKMGYSKEQHNVFKKYVVDNLGASILDKIGFHCIKHPGMFAGRLSREAAFEMGLISCIDSTIHEVTVATSLIDAHAGAMGMLSVKSQIKEPISNTLFSLAGTSTCHMHLHQNNRCIKGVWGPYKDVILSDYYLHEAGQSMTGTLIDYMILQTQEGKELENLFDACEENAMAGISRMLNSDVMNSKNEIDFKCSIHILPSYHGNRSPLADPRLKGAIYGLTHGKEPNLLTMYMATVESLAYETKFIVEMLTKNESGEEKVSSQFTSMIVSGGLGYNRVYLQTLANVLNINVVRMFSRTKVDLMLLGACYIGRHALLHSNQEIHGCNVEMVKYPYIKTEVFRPVLSYLGSDYYTKRYKSYRALVKMSQKIENIMEYSE